VSFKKKILLAGLLMLLHFLTGCSSVRITEIRRFTRPLDVDKAFVNHLSGWRGGSGSLTAGIIPGLSFPPRLFINIKVPLSADIVNSPVVEIHSRGKIVQVKEPISGYGFYARWDSNAIGDIAQRYGLKKVYFADMEIFSILGIWRHEKVLIYGE